MNRSEYTATSVSFFKVCAYVGLLSLAICYFPFIPGMGRFGGETRPLTYVFLFPLFFVPFCQGYFEADRLVMLWLVFLLFSTLNLFVVIVSGGAIAAAINAFLSINLGLWFLIATTRGYWLRISADKMQKIYLYVALILVIYGYFEIFHILGFPGFENILQCVRKIFVVRYQVFDRVTWLANEPSFGSFQICSALILNELYFSERKKMKMYTFMQGSLLVQVVFTQSLLCYLSAVIILIFLISKRMLLIMFGVIAILGWGFLKLSYFHGQLAQIASRCTALISGTDASLLTRYYLTLSSYLACFYTNFLGFGLGQYRFHWRDVFTAYGLPHNITYGLLWQWRASEPVKPYSVVGGICAELGIIGGVIFLMMLLQVFSEIRQVRSRRLRRIMIAAFVYVAFIFFANAYAPVTPIIWFLLGVVYLKAKEKSHETRPCAYLRGKKIDK